MGDSWAFVLVVAVLAFGAAARVTRFVTADDLAEPIRSAARRRFGADGLVATLVECPWCVSIWVAAPLAPLSVWAAAPQLWDREPGWFTAAAIAWWLTLSHLTGELLTRER